MIKIQQVLLMFLSLFLYTNLLAQEPVEFDFDAMDNAMIETGLDEKIQIKTPSRFEMALRRIADPILFFFFRSYTYLKERYTNTITAIKTVFNRRFRRISNHDENSNTQQA